MITGVGRELSSWIDRPVVDIGGDPIGVLVDVYADAAHRPAWLAINTGLLGEPIAVAPVRGASLLGEHVVVRHDRHTVVTAPAVEGALLMVDPAVEQFLSAHYSRRASAAVHPSRRYIP